MCAVCGVCGPGDQSLCDGKKANGREGARVEMGRVMNNIEFNKVLISHPCQEKQFEL